MFLSVLGFSSPQSSKGQTGQTTKLIAIYAVTLLLVLVVFSGRDFSVLMTFGSLTRFFGFLIVLSLIFTSRSAAGVSLKSLQLYAATFVFRLFSILRHEGYLPYDKTGDWIYHCYELGSLGGVAAAIWLIVGPLKRTYDAESDVFGAFKIPSELGALYLLLPCVLLAALIHPNLNGDWLSDVCWTSSMYLESVSVVPQLYMFQRSKKGKIQMLMAHFVVALGVARAMDGVFWLFSYRELVDANAGRMPGYLAMISQLVHVIILGDFFYFYALALKKGDDSMALPTHGGLDATV